MKIHVPLSVTVLLCAAGLAHAGPVTYTISTTGAGSLNGVTYTSNLITLTEVGDTSGIVGGGGFFTNVGTVTFNISGVGSGTFTDTMEVFVNQGSPAAGFGDATQGRSVLDTFNSAFSTYNLGTSIGPVTDSPFINAGNAFPTTAGAFIIDRAGNSMFTATTAPE